VRAFWQARTERPEVIFLVLSIVFGVALCVAIPPLAGGNETFNFGRAVGVAYGNLLVGDVRVPGGLVRLIDMANAHFTESAHLPLGVSGTYFADMARVPLDASAPSVLPADPIAVLNPVAYAPQAICIRLLCLLGIRPLPIFYLARAAGMGCAILMTYLAIRLSPSHKNLCAAIALLPPLTFSRGTVDADQVTVAISLLFIASVWRAVLRTPPASAGELLQLAALGFVAGQCKSAYFLLPVLALAVPRARFQNFAVYAGWMAAIILPGMVANFAYMLALKHGYFAHASYHSWAGDADPAAQIALILHAPSRYIGVMLRTVFATPLIPLSVTQMLGTFGPPVSFPTPVTAVLAGLIGLVAITDPTARGLYSWRARALAASIALAAVGIALTLLYIQWNGVGAPVIEGFQGRYLYPVLLLPIMSLHATRSTLFGMRAPIFLASSGVFGLTACLATCLWAYYA
jgi:hypothetical protein